MRLDRRSLLAAMPGLAAAPALAQSPAEVFPARPLRMIVPFAPGGPLDILGRPIAERLGALLGQTVIFENKPGANGIVATQQVVEGDAVAGRQIIVGLESAGTVLCDDPADKGRTDRAAFDKVLKYLRVFLGQGR